MTVSAIGFFKHLVLIGSSPSYLSGLDRDSHSEHAVREATQICRHQSLSEPLSPPDLSLANDVFHTLDPKLGRNELPTKLHDLTDHRAFRRKLKTFLFEHAFTT